MVKKLLYSIFALLTASQLHAQITLNAAGYTSSLIGIDSQRETAVGTTYPSFAPAASGTWDMTICSYATPIYYDYRVASTTGAQFADSTQGTFGGANYQTNVERSVTATGYVSYGQVVQRNANDLSTVSGTPGDSLVIDGQYMTYSVPDTMIKFPATYMSNWQTHFKDNLTYHLTLHYLIYMYSNAPGYVRTITNTVDTVIGWGVMRVISLSSTASSPFMSVLQVKCLTYNQDSFYLNGSPAPSLLLTAMGITQGKKDTVWEQNYYRVGEVEPLAYVSFDSGYRAANLAVTDGVNLALGTNNIVNDDIVKIFPNPIINRMFSLELPQSTGAYSYELIDMMGHTVVKNNMSGNRETITVPTELANGIYFLRVYENGNQYCVRGIDVSN